MKFSLFDANGKEIEHERYLLSLKDMNQSENLLELIEAGASSFKIEGRLKDVPYVKNVTAAYSEKLNEIVRRYPDKYCRASFGQCVYSFKPDLRRTFNRGYTSYFAHGRQSDIASFDTPKAIGEFVGTVKEIRHDSFNVAGVSSFTNGDGLCFLQTASLRDFVPIVSWEIVFILIGCPRDCVQECLCFEITTKSSKGSFPSQVLNARFLYQCHFVLQKMVFHFMLLFTIRPVV